MLNIIIKGPTERNLLIWYLLLLLSFSPKMRLKRTGSPTHPHCAYQLSTNPLRAVFCLHSIVQRGLSKGRASEPWGFDSDLLHFDMPSESFASAKCQAGQWPVRNFTLSLWFYGRSSLWAMAHYPADFGCRKNVVGSRPCSGLGHPNNF